MPRRRTGTALTIVPADAARWHDVRTLFGPRGGCANCWCMAWRLPRDAYEGGKTGGNRARLRRLIHADPSPGILGFDGKEVVGWCSVAPRSEFATLARSRALRAIDEELVWSISCVLVRKDVRRRGFGAELIAGAASFAAAQGARIIEGYPYEPAHPTADVFLWTGTIAAFRAAGFTEVARRTPTRPIMRAYVIGPGES